MQYTIKKVHLPDGEVCGQITDNRFSQAAVPFATDDETGVELFMWSHSDALDFQNKALNSFNTVTVEHNYFSDDIIRIREQRLNGQIEVRVE